MRIFKHLGNLAGAGMFLLVFASFLIQILGRYVFNAPQPWTDDIIKIGFVWVVFWGAAVQVRLRDHISFDVFFNLMPQRLQKGVKVLSYIACIVLLAFALPTILDFIGFSGWQKTSILRIPFSYVYAPIALFVLAIILQMIWQVIRELLGPSQDLEITDDR